MGLLLSFIKDMEDNKAMQGDVPIISLNRFMLGCNKRDERYLCKVILNYTSISIFYGIGLG